MYSKNCTMGNLIKGATERFTEKMGRILYYHKKLGNEQHTALRIMPKVKMEYFERKKEILLPLGLTLNIPSFHPYSKEQQGKDGST
jgi:hypothetical protein